MNERSTLQTGDPMPAVALADPSGRIVDLSNQRTAGRIIVLWAAGAGESPMRFARIAETISRFDGLAVAVVDTPPPALPEPLSDHVLLDPERRLIRALGRSAETLLVIDTDMRIAGVFDGDGIDAMAATCRDIFERSQADSVMAQAPVLLIRNVLDGAFCRRLIGYWEAGEKLTDTVSAHSVGQSVIAQAYKRRQDVIVRDKRLIDDLRDAFSRRFVSEVFKAFQCRAVNHEAFRIGCYSATEEGFFARHRDNATKYTAHRQFAMTLNLNTGEYDGGGLCFPEYGRQIYAPEAGGAVVFSCSLLHEALPVTAGRRFALFSFFYDDPSATAEREMIAAERAAGRNVLHD